MRNCSFSRWAGPLVGAGVGCYFGVQGAHPAGEEFSLQWLLFGGVLGLVGGCLVMLLDPPTSEAASADAPAGDVEEEHAEAPNPGSLIGRFLAVLSCLLFLAPIVGLGLGCVAIIANRRTTGWPRTVSWAGAILSLAVTVAFMVLVGADAN